jgi:hypothetical protein
MIGSEKSRLMMLSDLEGQDLTAEAVQGAALSLQSVDDIHGGDSLALGVLGVGDSVTDDVLKEHLEHTAGLFVDEARDALDTATTSQTTNSGLGDSLDVVTKNLAMTFSATLPESLASFAATRHDEFLCLSASQLTVSGLSRAGVYPAGRRDLIFPRRTHPKHRVFHRLQRFFACPVRTAIDIDIKLWQDLKLFGTDALSRLIKCFSQGRSQEKSRRGQLRPPATGEFGQPG